jgi:hypothetical protein
MAAIETPAQDHAITVHFKTREQADAFLNFAHTMNWDAQDEDAEDDSINQWIESRLEEAEDNSIVQMIEEAKADPDSQVRVSIENIKSLAS